MKMLAYAVEDEERPFFEKYRAASGFDITLTAEKPSLAHIKRARGMDAINVLSDTVLTPEMWDAYRAAGVRFAVTRCIGTVHMNRAYAESIGITTANVSYSPASVADYAIMLMLMVLRNIKPAMARYAGQDFTVGGLRGRELPNLTVGLIGAGPIACTLARHLQGFGCRVLYTNRTEKPAMEGYATYCTMPRLLAQSDIVSLHLALTDETRYSMGEAQFAAMKPGAVLINTARGGLVDNTALLHALESGHLAGAGLDVVDGDQTIYYRDYKNRIIGHAEMARLNSLPNVLMLQHLAYYTDQAVEDMVCHSLQAAAAWAADRT